jgi:hypothetical protein
VTDQPFANQNPPGSLYHPDREGVRSGDTDYHEPDCGCMFCNDVDAPGDIIRQAWYLVDGYEWNERKTYLHDQDHFMCEQATDLLSTLRSVLRAQGELTGIIDSGHVSPLEDEPVTGSIPREGEIGASDPLAAEAETLKHIGITGPDDLAGKYAELCDLYERTVCKDFAESMPEGLKLTSDDARAFADRVLEIMHGGPYRAGDQEE